jgi:hypothetical protein
MRRSLFKLVGLSLLASSVLAVVSQVSSDTMTKKFLQTSAASKASVAQT